MITHRRVCYTRVKDDICGAEVTYVKYCSSHDEILMQPSAAMDAKYRPHFLKMHMFFASTLSCGDESYYSDFLVNSRMQKKGKNAAPAWVRRMGSILKFNVYRLAQRSALLNQSLLRRPSVNAYLYKICGRAHATFASLCGEVSYTGNSVQHLAHLINICSGKMLAEWDG